MARTTQKTLKFLHIAGTVGFCAALLALLVLHASLPDPSQVEQFAGVRLVMGNVARWLLLPSTGLVVVSGLLAMAATDAYHNAGWVWMKLATGVLIMEGTLVGIQGPMQRAGSSAQSVLEGGELDTLNLATTLASELNSVWIILGVAMANIILGVYRPRFTRRAADKPTAATDNQEAAQHE